MSKDKVALRVWLKLLATSNIIEKGLNRFLDLNFGAQLSRFDALSALERHSDGLTMSELSKQLLVTNGNTTSLVKNLEADGFVSRKQTKSDRRIYKVHITKKGRDFFNKMTGPHQKALAAYFKNLPKNELEALLKLLERAETSARSNIQE